MKSRTKSNKNQNIFTKCVGKGSFWNEIMRGQRWSILVLSLLMFLIYPIQIILNCGNWEEQGRTWGFISGSISTTYMQLDPNVITYTGFGVLYLSIVIGAVAGVASFSYLHNQSKVAMFHSLPISRSKLLITKFTTATVTFLIPLLLANVLCVIVVITRGYSTKAFLISIAVLFFYNIVMYWMGYLIAAIAMLLTGRVFVGVCGTFVLSLYCVCMSGLITTYAAALLETMVVDTYDSWRIVVVLKRLSPFTYMDLVDWTQIRWVFISLLLVIILWEIQRLLMRIRPSEVAGRAMAYKRVGEVIKVALVILAGFASALFFYSVAYGVVEWMYFGAVFGVVVGYIVIQLIYGVVFRELFAQKLQIILVLVGVLAAIVLLVHDVFGYDSYIPEYDEIENINIEYNIAERYGLSGVIEQELYDINMGKDEETYALIELIVENAKSVVTEDIAWDEIRDIYVEYELKDGTTVLRSYECNLEEVEEALEYLWGNEAFLDATYPVRLLNVTNVSEMGFYDANNIDIPTFDGIFDEEGNVEQAGYSKEEFILAFMTAYQADALAITEAILEEESIATGYYAWTMPEEYIFVSSQGRFAIYPSFTNTIALMEEVGYVLN